MPGKNTALIKWVKDNFGHDKDKFSHIFPTFIVF